MDAKEHTAQQLRWNAFEKHFTDEMMEELTCAVSRVIVRLEKTTPWRDTLGVDDRLNTAILKTLEGKREWDPKRWSLFVQLYQAVRSEISTEIEHQIEHAPKVFDDTKLALVPVESAMSDALSLERNTSHEAAGTCFSRVLDELRKLAGKDKRVLKLLDMWSEGLFERAEIMERLKMSARMYGTVYQRLLRLAKELDSELRETVLDALAN